MKFSVLIPEKPSGRAMVACFKGLESQILKAGLLDASVKGIRINVQRKAIEIEVEE